MRLIAFIIAIATFCGCQKGDQEVQAVLRGFENFCGCNPLERYRRLEFSGVQTNLSNVAIDSLASNDVIVAVNGYPFYKKTFDEMSLIEAEQLAKSKDANREDAQSRLSERRKGYVRHFVAQRLLVDKAIRLGVVTTNQIRESICKTLLDAARLRNVSVHKYVKRFGNHLDLAVNEMALSYAMGKVIEAKVPPLANVDDSFVSNVAAQATQENVRLQATNKCYRARLEDWRKSIVDGRVDFAAVANRFSNAVDLEGKRQKDGFWGEFEEGQMDDPEIERVVFKLPVNRISEILEDEDGLRIVKVLAVTPQKTDDKGNVVTREKRKIAQIYLEKEPLMIIDESQILKKNLIWQMQQQALNQYVTGLLTNGENKVVYPNGIPRYE